MVMRMYGSDGSLHYVLLYKLGQVSSPLGCHVIIQPHGLELLNRMPQNGGQCGIFAAHELGNDIWVISAMNKVNVKGFPAKFLHEREGTPHPAACEEYLYMITLYLPSQVYALPNGKVAFKLCFQAYRPNSTCNEYAQFKV